MATTDARLAQIRQRLKIPEDAPLQTSAVEVQEALRQLSLMPPRTIFDYVASLSERQHVVLWFSVLLYSENSLRRLLDDWEKRPMVEGSDPRRDMHLFIAHIWSGQYSVTMDGQALFPFSKYPSLCVPHRSLTNPVAIACAAVAAAAAGRLFASEGTTSRGKSVLLGEFRYNSLLPRIIDRGRVTALYLHGIYTRRPKSKPDMIAALQKVCAELESARSPWLAELSSIQRAVSTPSFTVAHLGPFVYPAQKSPSAE